MKPAFSYYGGKGRLAPWIASLLPDHRVYVEPFAGSAAVLLAKRPSTHEILNDVDGNVVTFFRVLRDRPEDLERACRLTPYARDEFDAAHLVDPDLNELERARRFWIRCNQSFASTGTVSTGWSTSIIRGANNARSASNRVERFLSIAERLRHVTIEHRAATTPTNSPPTRPTQSPTSTTNGRSGSNPKVVEALWCNRPIGDQLTFGAPSETSHLEVPIHPSMRTSTSVATGDLL